MVEHSCLESKESVQRQLFFFFTEGVSWLLSSIEMMYAFLLPFHQFSLTVIPTISFSTGDVVVEEDDESAEVCLDLSIPLSTNLEVVVTSAAGSGKLFLGLLLPISRHCPSIQLTVAVTL